jgi:hypothetical protein
VLAATLFEHESAASGVDVAACLSDDVLPELRMRRVRLSGSDGSGCVEECCERGDGLLQERVNARLLVGGVAGG